ncbi:DUF2189 domain-containing protein [Pelagibaculum spongiae]|uniref:DUF2189 domain-containing protein n=1 Tax=Pelagibaculum spongiae TaxID=2080658 RepID=A0A2V1H7I3_9GAMM|nr:DUF2189 domain-containing protein [Pelagibaculum spongiae]PVZ72432.1 hypothetical protein DC094_05355 [Pelagibaculum spongiae]
MGKTADMPQSKQSSIEASPQSTSSRLPDPADITLDAPWHWLAMGWQDFRKAGYASFAYGVMMVCISWLVTLVAIRLEQVHLILPMAAGFFLMAPLLGGVAYDISRQLETRDKVSLPSAIGSWKRNPIHVAAIGLIMMLFMMAWMRIAMVMFALSFTFEHVTFETFFDVLLTSKNSIPFLLIGSGLGAVLALLVFALTAISIPMLLDRETDAFSAIITSFKVVGNNFAAMMLWAGLIVFLLAIGIMTFYIGLAVILPWLGHATWHAYRQTVPKTE